MPKLFLANSILTSFVALLVEMGCPSLALQVQKQTEAEVGDLLTDQSQGSRTTEMEWVFSESVESCDMACARICPTAKCDALARLEIDSPDKMKDLLETEMPDNPCEFYASPVDAGPFITGGTTCYPKRNCGSNCEHDFDACDFKNPTVKLCACELTLGTCTVAEDPHIEVFDGSQISLLASTAAVKESAGEKWLVKSASLKIQARFENVGNISLEDRHLFVRAVAIGGDILNGNVMVVGSLQDQITWNGVPILRNENSSFYRKEGKLFVNATRGSSSLVQDLSMENLGVNVQLLSGVSLIANRLHDHVNVVIKMPQQAEGQEGMCGNFNGVGSDDTLELTTARFDPNVVPGESLFAGRFSAWRSSD